MSVLVLTHDDVERLLSVRDCIPVMEEAFSALARGQAHQPLRMIVRPPEAGGIMGLMPSFVGGDRAAYGLKAICVFPGNPGRGLDAHQGGVLLFSAETGVLEALMNASAITAIRTAAVSALATRLLAREDAADLAVVGAGVQARWHLEALACVRSIRRARVASRRPEQARKLAVEMGSRLPFPVEPVDSPEAAVRGADLVVTATSSAEPVLRRGWIAAGAHICAVGSCVPTARELDSETMRDARLFVDRRESALSEAGDYVLAAREGVIGPDHIRADLAEVLVGARPGRTSPDEITVFESLGLAIEDLAAARHLHRRARQTGAGQTVEF